MATQSFSLCGCYALNLHTGIPAQADAHRCAGRLVHRKVFSIHLVHGAPLGHIDQKSGAYRSDAELEAAANPLGRGKGEPIISYCGGGIAATLNAFVLMKLGYEKVSVYDGSLDEWSADAAMPMEVG